MDTVVYTKYIRKDGHILRFGRDAIDLDATKLTILLSHLEQNMEAFTFNSYPKEHEIKCTGDEIQTNKIHKMHSLNSNVVPKTMEH